MELTTKQGFKQTEYGLIPKDWSLKNIGDLSTIFGRIGFRGYTVNDIVKEDQGAITLSPSNIVNGQLNLSKVTFLSWFKYEESPEIKIYNGDILLVKTGSTFGKTALVKNLDQKATLNPQIIVLKKIKCDNVFLGYMMGYPIIQNQITSTVVGGAIPTLSQEQVSRFQIPLPPTLKEQKAIATALSDVDDLIVSLEGLIAKKQAIKQGAMQQLLTPPHKGGKRLPGFSGEWVESELQQICEVRGGGTPPTSVLEYWNGNINWFTPTEVGSQKFIFNSTRKITALGLKSSSAQLLSKGSILLTTRASIGDAAILKNEACTNQGFQSLVPLNVKDSEFIYQLILTKRNDLISLSSGSTFLEISPKKVKTLLVYIPKAIEERDAISKILSDMDAEIEELETKKAKYQQLKQGMLQELLTGNTRLV
ncbi:restriction endonuclease subunit S [Tenacibaculum maritimum]|uniref:restriction endonuclease subunit S n=1 Tax=Tenacibaculum maritimum TaxID=107401 RepID=UPI0012E6A58D|nr:restriction endonuclease subunit S [Tenacibaculum maritimum]CAA0185527.1 conserved hypothetical protein [Tenacibaculum maritimum]